jgi:iron(III) transport system ATP-binding protein
MQALAATGSPKRNAAVLKVTNLYKRFVTDRGDVRAVEDVSFEVPEGQFYTLVGPSGCGKTTTLRCIAGLEQTDAGEIYIGDEVVSSPDSGVFVPINKRNIGMVFQSYAIWPHLTVFENVAFPLRVGKIKFSDTQIKTKVKKALETVRLAGLEERPAPQLSGGQQQRLALARALVREPRLLLLDEPLSNLDAKLRESMRSELRDLQRQLKITTIYVTHDQLEAVSMSNVIAVMHEGRIVQEGPPREIYDRPNSTFVADFIGSTNFISGQIVQDRIEDETCTIASSIGLLRCYFSKRATPECQVLISIRPENISLSSEGSDGSSNCFEGTVVSSNFFGEYLDCRIEVAQQTIRVRQHPSLKVREGDRIFVRMPAEHCVVIPHE